MRYLSKRLEEVTVVSAPPDDQSKIYFGAYVTLEEDNGNKTRYRLVGPDEIDPRKGYISIDSPLGTQLLGKSIDAELLIDLPTGARKYFVINIEYE